MIYVLRTDANRDDRKEPPLISPLMMTRGSSFLLYYYLEKATPAEMIQNL